MDIVDTSAVEPKTWILAFGRKSTRRWIDWLAWGRYKHVRAAAPLPHINAWIFYDVHLGGTTIVVAPNGPEAEVCWSRFRHDSDLLLYRMGPRATVGAVRSVVSRYAGGFFCTVAIRHLIGVRSSALRPTRLYRDCVAVGAQPLE